MPGALTRRQAIEITDHRFHTDADKLIKTLEKIMGVQTPPQSEPPKKPEKPGFPRLVATAGVVGIVLVAGVYFGLILPQPIFIQPGHQVTEQSADALHAETDPVPTKEPTAEQPQKAIPDPITQLVTEQPNVSAIEPEMARIPSGKFRMGSPETEEGRASDEGPQHEVNISRPFAISRHEITVGQFRQFVEDAGYRTTAEKNGQGCYGWNADKKEVEQLPERLWNNPGFQQSDDHPVVCVSWDDAKAYVAWLSGQSGKPYRLPTEAEWEYAARAGTTTARFYPDGQQCQYANGLGQEGKSIAASGWVLAECADGYLHTAPAGSFTQNQYDLFDMLGNVWEWTQDCWHDNYNKAPGDGSAWLEQNSGDCGRRVVRGGSWYYYDPQDLRSASRGGGNTDVASDALGFRIARAF